VQKTNVRVVGATTLIAEGDWNGKFREDCITGWTQFPSAFHAARQERRCVPVVQEKFASDFAERYRMPALTLQPEAQIIELNTAGREHSPA